MLDVTIRVARVADATALLAIYAPYVRETAITFEYEVPSVLEFASRIRDTLERYPYLVAESGGVPIGYAYAGPFKERAAYDWAVETSIYVARGACHVGVGRTLHDALETCLRVQGILNMCACIGVPDGADDEHLDHNSEQFHTHMGYRLVGEFRQCGYKFGRWYNMVWMEKILGEHALEQSSVKPFPEIVPDLVQAEVVRG